MDRGVAVVRDHALRDQDRVLEVVAVPGHERDQHVLAERELAQVGRRAVGDHVAARDLVALADDRTLVDVRVLVGTRVLDQVVDVDADLARGRLVVVHPDHDPVRIDVVDVAAAQRGDHRAGVDRAGALDAGADHRLLRTQAGHGLALHVRAHQRAVGVVVLEERDQRGRDRDDLRGCDVDVLDLVGRGQQRLAVDPHRDQLVGQHAGGVHRGVGLGDHVAAFLDRRQVVDVVGEGLAHDLAVRGLEEAVLVELGVQRQRVDQADVRALGRLDRADATVVGRVHVAHLEAGTLAGQAARAQRGDATLVRDLRQRVGLVHELRQLARPEELADGRADRLAVDQVVRHQVLGLGLAETLLHRPLDADQARAKLVLGQLADAAHPAVAEVVDVVDLALAVAQVDQDLDDRQQVLVGQRHRTDELVAADATVELHAADLRQVVRVRAVEQAVEQRLDGLLGRRLARTHHPVDRDPRGGLVGGVVGTQRLRHERTLVEVVRVQRLELLDRRDPHLLQQVLGQLVIGLGDDLAGVAVDHVGREHAAQHVVLGHRDPLELGRLHLADVLGVDPLVLRDDDAAVLVRDVEAGDLAAHPVGDQLHQRAFRHQLEIVEDEEVGEDLLGRQADRLQQDRHRHLAAAVDAEVQHVLRVELEVEPRAAVRDDPRREQQLARAVGLAAVVLEEHARRAVQLRDDDPLGAVDDERAVGGHERNLAHVHLLLLDFLDGRLGRLAVHDDQAHAGTQRRAEGQATLLAFHDVEGRVAERVADELQPRHLVVRGDREDRGEGRLQAFVLAVGDVALELQELRVRLELGLEEVRHVLHDPPFGEGLADALLFGERIGLGGHGLSGKALGRDRGSRRPVRTGRRGPRAPRGKQSTKTRHLPRAGQATGRSQ